MVVTIEDRSVTFIPIELESELQLEPCCVTCKKTSAPLRKCSNCKIVSYCSRECQTQDWSRHKSEDGCFEIKKARRQMDKAEISIRANEALLLQWYQDRHGLFMDETTVQDLFQRLAGRFGCDPYTDKYKNWLGTLRSILFGSAQAGDQTRVLWEELLKQTIEMKRLTHLSSPDLDCTNIPPVLLKLHRDDDAMGFIIYWIHWRIREDDNDLEDPIVSSSNKGEYPFPCQQDCRYNDLDEEIRILRESEAGEYGGLETIVSFCAIALAIKLRHVCVYRNVSMRAQVFRDTASGQWLPADVVATIVSFLTGGDEGASLYATQLQHANDLMDLMDAKFPRVLPAVLDPSRLPTVEDYESGVEIADGDHFNVRLFLDAYGDGTPLMSTLESMLKERYGIEAQL